MILIGAAVSLPTDTARGQDFREVSRSSGIDHYCFDPNRVCGGAAFFDYDGDGYEDLHLTGGLRPDRLYRNLGDGTFEDVTQRAGLGPLEAVNTVGVATGDIDNDGDRDLFVTTAERFRNFLFRNEGDGRFTDVSEAAGIVGEDWSTAVAFGDVDLDGYLDLYVANYALYDGLPYDEHLTGGLSNQLYHNNRDGTFTEIADSLGVENFDGLTLAVSFGDLNGDSRTDLYVANDFGQIFLPNTLFENTPDGFADMGAASGTDADINGMGIALGDFDEDGDFDMYVSNMDRNRLYENVSAGALQFEDIAIPKAVSDSFSTSWGTIFFDYDNDTYLDLMVANGRVLPSYDLSDPKRALRLIQPQENRLYRGGPGGSLTEVSQEAGVADTTRGRGLVYADYDEDGDLDVFVAVVSKEEETGDHSLLYRNDVGNRSNWLMVDLEGAESNRDGYGSTVEAHADDRKWLRQVMGGSSYLSQNSSTVHFGLGERVAVDSLIVRWPSGRRDVHRDVAANQTVRIVEGSSAVSERGGAPDRGAPNKQDAERKPD
jgi:hypothetical protein